MCSAFSAIWRYSASVDLRTYTRRTPKGSGRSVGLEGSLVALRSGPPRVVELLHKLVAAASNPPPPLFGNGGRATTGARCAAAAHVDTTPRRLVGSMRAFATPRATRWSG